MTYKNNLSKFVDLINKVSKNEEGYKDKYDSIENSRSRYDYRNDPGYKKRAKQNEEYYEKKAFGDKYSHIMHTEGMNNSFADGVKSIYLKKMKEANSALGAQLTKQEHEKFEKRKRKRIERLLQRYSNDRYNDMYTLGKANEEYLGVGE